MRQWPLSTVINPSLTTNWAFPSVPLTWCEVLKWGSHDHITVLMLHKCAVCLFSCWALHIAILLWFLLIYLSTLRHGVILIFFLSFLLSDISPAACDYKHLRTDLQLNNSPLCVWTISQMLIMLFKHKIFTYFTFFGLWKSKKYHKIGFWLVWPLSLNPLPPKKTNLFYFSSVFLHFAVDEDIKSTSQNSMFQPTSFCFKMITQKTFTFMKSQAK